MPSRSVQNWPTRCGRASGTPGIAPTTVRASCNPPGVCGRENPLHAQVVARSELPVLFCSVVLLTFSLARWLLVSRLLLFQNLRYMGWFFHRLATE
jgi:hypothetical protein